MYLIWTNYNLTRCICMNHDGKVLKACAAALFLFALICMPASASQETIEAEVAGIIELADALYDDATTILEETKVINRDANVSDEIKLVSKPIHMASHELEHIAEHIQDDALELQTLVADPVTNRAAIDGIVADIGVNAGNYTALLESQHENVHELEEVVPASHKANAESVHDAAHQAERDAKNLVRSTEALVAALDAGTAAPAPSSPAESPGFGAVAALGGLAAVAYAARRR